jgi:hypothetical protein
VPAPIHPFRGKVDEEELINVAITRLAILNYVRSNPDSHCLTLEDSVAIILQLNDLGVAPCLNIATLELVKERLLTEETCH